ncbi:MAG TPA: aromatic ring-hydroxylating dioxygenase subunit alpha [Candidatus Binataceae bacterium]|nr:aromatic ring-hydroxylating dioxygenase subunit alpha [Candidatus Binataceae bacterium]
MYVRNAWYIAAWSDEVAERPIGRRILGEPVVLFRDRAGAVAALQDRCCHRGAPLSCGEVVERGIQCGYHGLIFDSAGKCVLVPGDHKVPPGAQVPSYPVVERDALVWVWMGDRQKAEHALIIRYPYHNDSSAWPHRHTMMHIRSDHLLVIDNLMDLSHLGYVHKGNVGGDANTHVEAKMRTVRTPDGVRFERWMLDSTPPPTYVKTVGFKGKVDRWQEVEFVAPNAVLQWNGAIDAGAGALRDWQYSSPRENCFSFRLFHGITPETESTSYYFWSAANGYNQDDPRATVQLFDEIARTFEQDKAILEAQAQRLAELPDGPLVEIHGDAARIHARRAIDRLLAKE